MKLFDSEWKVMEVLWQEGDLTAKEISLRLAESIGWNKNTTYTVLKKCIDKGAIERREPNFVCHAAITKAQAQKEEADSLLDKVFGGSAELLFASILSDRPLSKEEAARLRALVEEYRATGTALLIATLALGNVVFVIYDFLLKRLERVLAARKRRTE